MRTFMAFILGAVSGIAGGVLFAPKEGKKTRKEANKMLQKQLNDIEKKLNEQSGRLVNEYNEKVDEYSKKGKSVIGDLKDKVKV